MIASAIAGFLAGSIHVIAGPDHLTAIAPMAIQGPRHAWLRGMQWGIGHVLGLGVVAVLAWWFRGLLPIERISGVSEQLVGVVLVAVGLWALRLAAKNHVHVHEHTHDGTPHLHVHAHSQKVPHKTVAAHKHSHASLWIGVLHGAAGSAHLLAILPALAFPSRAQAVAYLLGYASGTVCTMACFAALLGRLSLKTGRGPKMYRLLTATAGTMAIVVGGFWLTRT